MSFRIGSAQGFYGDDVTRALPMIEGGYIDVVCFEALSELTLAILQKDRLSNPDRGYTFDINIIARQILPKAFERKIPLITNGGGLNPLGAAAAVAQTASKLGLRGLRIAAVTGDDILEQLADLQRGGASFAHLETGEALPPTADLPIVTASVYLGAAPIVEALKAGADIIIAGRVADPCLYLAPLVAHYGWSWDDWDRLAAGIVAGHLLECTGQVVGGNSLALIDRVNPRDLPHLGYPIASVDPDGSFAIYGTPSLPSYVCAETVKEQLLYEVHDPAHYLTPDVTADFTTLRLDDDRGGCVRVSGVTGRPRPEQLKVNLGLLEGYMRELIFTIGWPEAWRKVEQLKTMIDETWHGLPIRRVEYRYLGINSLYGELAPLPDDPYEVIVRVVFTADDQDTLKTAVRRIMANGLSGPAGMSVSGTTVGAEPRAILGLWPALIDRSCVQPQVTVQEVE
jgi:hypothetical protein